MSLLEALISLLIMSILGLGLAYVTAKASVVQHNMNAQGLAVSGMRNLLQQGSCTSSQIALASSTVAVGCTNNSTAYTITMASAGSTTTTNGTISLPTMQTSTAANTQLGGQISVDATQQ